MGLQQGPNCFTNALEVETPPQLAQPCQNKQAGCTLLPQGAEENAIPRLIFGSNMLVLLLEGRRALWEGTPACVTPPVTMAETAALAEHDTLWVGCAGQGKCFPHAHREHFRSEHSLGSFQGFCRCKTIGEDCSKAWRSSSFLVLSFQFVFHSKISQVTFSTPFRKFRGREQSVPAIFPCSIPASKLDTQLLEAAVQVLHSVL